MWLRPPRRNNAPLVIFPVRVDNCDLQPVDHAERVNAALSVVERSSTLSTVGPSKMRTASAKAMPCSLTLRRFSLSVQVYLQSGVFTQRKYRGKSSHSIMTINSCQPVERFSYKIVVVGSRFGPPRPPRDISLISLSTVWIFQR